LPFEIEQKMNRVKKPDPSLFTFIPRVYIPESPIEPPNPSHAPIPYVQPKNIPLEDLTRRSIPSVSSSLPMPIAAPPPPPPPAPLDLENISQLLSHIQSVDLPRFVPTMLPAMPFPYNPATQPSSAAPINHLNNNQLGYALHLAGQLLQQQSSSRMQPPLANIPPLPPQRLVTEKELIKQPKGRKPPPKIPYLPCKHFMSTGTCPFGPRCTFLHGNPPNRP
jgi:hypothetical protein